MKNLLLAFMLLPVLAGCASDRAYKYGPQANPAYQPLKYDQTKVGWKLLEDVPFDGEQFTPELVGFLKPGESSVNSNVMKQRAIDLNAHLGQGHAEYLLDHQELIPTEWRGRLYLVFPGTVWRVYFGEPSAFVLTFTEKCIPYLYWDFDSWRIGARSLESKWHSGLRFVRPRK